MAYTHRLLFLSLCLAEEMRDLPPQRNFHALKLLHNILDLYPQGIHIRFYINLNHPVDDCSGRLMLKLPHISDPCSQGSHIHMNAMEGSILNHPVNDCPGRLTIVLIKASKFGSVADHDIPKSRARSDWSRVGSDP